MWGTRQGRFREEVRKMLNNYILGDKKLTEEEFADKYWRGGIEEYVYQFHTMHIEDGMDERQQLLINNDRALFNQLASILRVKASSGHLNAVESRIVKAEKAIRRLAVLQLLGFLILMFIQLISIFS